MRKSSNLRKSEAGQVLVYVTIVLMLSLLVIPPLLEFVFGAGRTAQIREDRMVQVYAADAGIEAGYQVIIGNSTGLPQSPEEDPWLGNITDVNGNYVEYVVEKKPGKGLYKVTSTATNWEGASTTIESYVGGVDYNDFLDNVLSSKGDITIQPNSYIEGNVTLNGELDNKGYIDGNVTDNVPAWPAPGALAMHYWPDVDGYPCGCGSTIGVNGNETIFLGPCYTSGDLTVDNAVGKWGNLTLGGTLYIQGNFDFKKFVNLRLEGHTIYAEGDITLEPDAQIFGPGCVIAEGSVVFRPKQVGEDFLFVMSVTGSLDIQPNGDLYGAFAGVATIDISPGNTLKWIEYPTDESGAPALNFPGGDFTIARVLTYTILE